MIQKSDLTFGQVLEYLKLGESGLRQVSRENWYGSKAMPLVKLQKPDENSKMTMPYLYMEKKLPTMSGGLRSRFPLDLSCESILAEDWMIII